MDVDILSLQDSSDEESEINKIIFILLAIDILMVLVKVVNGSQTGPQKARVVDSAKLGKLWQSFMTLAQYDMIPEGLVATNWIDDVTLQVYKVYTDDRRGIMTNNPSNMDPRNVAVIKFVDKVLRGNY